MQSLWQDARLGSRALLKRPGFTATAVLTLALGIGGTTAVFAVVRSVLLRPLPFSKPEELVLVWGTSPKLGQTRDVISGPTFLDLQRRSSSFAGIAAFASNEMTLRLDQGSGIVPGLEVTADFFDVLGVKPMLGRAFEAGGADADRVLLGYDHWRNRLGGDPRVVGRPLAAASQPHTVLGVLPPGFSFFQGRPDVVTLVRSADLEAQPRTHYFYWVVGRLKPGVSAAQAQSDLDGVMRQIAADFPIVRDWQVTVERLDALLAEPVRPALLSLLAAVGLVLLIACTNVAHLLLARGLERRRELALRLALGASRWRIARQLLVESALLAGAGGVLGAALAVWGVEALTRLLPGEVAVAGSAATIALPPIEMDGVASTVAAGLALLTALFVGVLPAREARAVQARSSLQAGDARTTGDRREGRSRRVLVGVETALATIALVMAGLMLRTVVELARTDPGFRPEGVVSMIFGRVHDLEPEPRARYYEDVLRRASAVPGVTAAALNDYVLLTNEDDYEGFEIEGRPRPATASWPREEWRRISPDYFAVTGTPLVRGRLFSERDDARSPSVVLVNQAFAAKHWPGEDPVGRRIRITHKAYGWSEVVGIVGDVREVALGKPAKPMMFVPYQRAPRPVMALFARIEGDPARAVPALRNALWAVDASRPVLDVRALTEVVRRSMSVERLTLQLAAALGVLAGLLTAGGIYGVVSHAAGRRTREIGVRLAIGARIADVFWLLVRQGAAPALLGLLAGLAASRGLARLLESQLYGVTPSDPTTLAATALLVATVTLAACAGPARRAAHADPAAALRCE